MLATTNLSEEFENLREVEDLEQLYGEECVNEDERLNDDDFTLSMTQPSKDDI